MIPCELPSDTTRPASRRFLIAAAGIACLGAFLMFFELGTYRTLTKHEGFVAVVSREMAATGDLVVPRFGGLPRLKKPPLMYWGAAGTSRVLGRHDAWTVRVPSAISALLLAMLVGVWAGKWYGRPAGLAAGLIQISCLYVLDFGRKAEADMLLCLLTTAALFLVSGARTQGFWKSLGSLRWTGIYALAGLSWLAKFHYGPVMIFSVTIIWMCLKVRSQGSVRTLGSEMLQFLNPAGLLLFAAAVAVWPLLVLRELPAAWDVWQAETMGRAVGQLGRQPVWFYVPQVFLLTLPWSPLLFAGMRNSFRQAWRQGDHRERFLWIWFGTQFVILTAAAFKHHHYLMAALPALTLMISPVATRLAASFVNGERRLNALQSALLAVTSVGIAVAVPVVVAGKWPHLADAALAGGLCVGISGCAAIVLLHVRRVRSAGAFAAAGFLGCYVVAMSWIVPDRDRRVPNVQFAEQVNEQRAGQPMCVYGLKEHPVVYYLDRAADRVEAPQELSRRLQVAQRLLVVTDAEQLPQLAGTGTARVIGSTPIEPDRPRPKGPPLILVELQAPDRPSVGPSPVKTAGYTEQRETGTDRR